MCTQASAGQRIEELILQQLTKSGRQLEVLDGEQLSEALHAFVDKNENRAISEFLFLESGIPDTSSHTFLFFFAAKWKNKCDSNRSSSGSVYEACTNPIEK